MEMTGDDVTNMAPTDKGTQAVSVTILGVVNSDANKIQENGQKNDEIVYTLKAVVESETDKEKIKIR